MQQLTQTGYLGKDPEMRYTPGGKAVTNFSLGVTVGWGENKHTQWWKVTCWQKLAETVNQYLSKGKWVLVQGTVNDEDGNPRLWQGNDGNSRASFEMTANSVDFGPRQDNGGQKEEEPYPNAVENDIPF
jgi:single-strand DNA-binding protein